MKKAFIFGITGQDGSYLAELLLEKGYEVHGLMRRASTFTTKRIDHIFDKLHVHYGNMLDGQRLATLLAEVRPLEVYNLAAQSHVRVSFDCPVETLNTIALGTARLLEAVRAVSMGNHYPRVYQASSSEMFGSSAAPQSEITPFQPNSPYACAKVCAHHLAQNYRAAYSIPVSCGILFNHESPRRGETFVTRKITRAVGRIKQGLQDKLYLGNMLAERDWGWAPDYVRAMWMVLQEDMPGDYVIATGKSHHVGEFVEIAFSKAGLRWQDYVETDERYFRPSEVHVLRGQPAKAERELGWSTSVGFEELVQRMVVADMGLAKDEALLKKARQDE